MLCRFAQAAHDADRHQVLCCVDRGRRLIEGEQVERCLTGVLAVEDVLADEMGVDGQVARLERVDVAAEAFGGGDDRAAIAEKGDATMTVRHQVLHPAGGARTVVDQHRVGVEERRRAIDEHDRHPHPALLDEVAVIVACRHQNQAVAPPFGKGLDELAFARRALVEARCPDGDSSA